MSWPLKACYPMLLGNVATPMAMRVDPTQRSACALPLFKYLQGGREARPLRSDFPSRKTATNATSNAWAMKHIEAINATSNAPVISQQFDLINAPINAPVINATSNAWVMLRCEPGRLRLIHQSHGWAEEHQVLSVATCQRSQ